MASGVNPNPLAPTWASFNGARTTQEGSEICDFSDKAEGGRVAAGRSWSVFARISSLHKAAYRESRPRTYEHS